MKLLFAILILSITAYAENPLQEKPLTLFEFGMLSLENELEGFQDDPTDVSVHYSKEKGSDVLWVNIYLKTVKPDKEASIFEAVKNIRVLHTGWKSQGGFSFGTHLTFLKYFIPESGRKLDPQFIARSEKWLLQSTKIWVQSSYGKNDGTQWVICEAWLKDKEIKRCWDNNMNTVKVEY